MAKHGLTVAKATKEEFKRVWDWLHTMEALFDGRGMFSTEEDWREWDDDEPAKKQLLQIEKFKKLETRAIPADIDYMSMEGLRTEAQEKLDKFRPVSIGQASRISGVSPADVNVLLVYLEKNRRSR